MPNLSELAQTLWLKINHMESEVRILCSKKLSKSFYQVEDGTVWESINLSRQEAKKIINKVIDNQKKEDNAITITITVI